MTQGNAKREERAPAMSQPRARGASEASPAVASKRGAVASDRGSAVDLTIGGMTCASCATRIERKLNRLDGVVASVNFATGTARVERSTGIALPTVVSTVESLGYTAEPVAPSTATNTEAAWGARVLVCAGLAAVVLAVTMVPWLQFRGSTLTALILGGVVVAWGGWPFHRAAALAARHRQTTMDTLVSLGALVAYGWSLFAVLTGRDDTYVEVATALVAFLLVGRWLEARGTRRAGSALR